MSRIIGTRHASRLENEACRVPMTGVTPECLEIANVLYKYPSRKCAVQVLKSKMCGTSFLNFSVRNVRIARMVRTELNIARALRLRRG